MGETTVELATESAPLIGADDNGVISINGKEMTIERFERDADILLHKDTSPRVQLPRYMRLSAEEAMKRAAEGRPEARLQLKQTLLRKSGVK